VIDPFELVRAQEMLRGYTARWFNEPYEVLAIEAEFEAPLVNPETGAESRTFALGGKLDCVVRDRRSDHVLLVESKSTSEDATPGSPYWLRTLISSQLSTYMVGMRSLGFEPTNILYDVLSRPAHRPISATPEEQRKYTKPTKADPVSRLYANQRDTDETPEEFASRIRESISVDPAKYYNRGTVVRMETEEREAAFDAWQTASNIREGRTAKAFPRNPDGCVKWGSPCSFLPVCAGLAELTDPFRYRRTENVHEELTYRSRSGRLPLLTNSEMSAFRTCQRLHHYRYDLGYRSIKSTEAQRAGTLVHRGLEGWWTAKKLGADAPECLGESFRWMQIEPTVASFLPEGAVA
jgi:PD-(D/E)XK nuclease superfamily